ncbi:hypothetical protein COU19_01205 [Candidatus Kaiserbacteria bacterium CG10_big_fil_rev_8_21_14_0_10_56_12]|uniref:Uncharacterized protein n=1 Tax=Candidatus Kaiserbacteria bacterium CG10_big_fil_rev_8_21_14_0_10_56_12 TaxID=1974611 RepID=A0A2H0UAB2_9BACT|nr:MAG: hypothetical protein COU19_01205 [Candidatus Kaiserbacteria bacterium CG10_big_fil_rev_8_21_14_0_10_56_12]
MNNTTSITLLGLALMAFAVVGGSSASAASQTYTGVCVDDSALVQSSGSQYSLCSDVVARNCPGGVVVSKTPASTGFQITCTVPDESPTQTCDPAFTSCAPGTIAPDGSINTSEIGTSSGTCNPAVENCPSATGATNNPPTNGGSGSASAGTVGNSAVGTNTANPNNGAEDVHLLNPLGSGSTDLESFLNSILDFVIRIGTIVVVIMMVYVGFKFVTAQGDPGEISKAREMLLWTVVGALILLGAKALAGGIAATVRALSVGG